jgi:hypothetical protein
MFAGHENFQKRFDKVEYKPILQLGDGLYREYAGKHEQVSAVGPAVVQWR